MEGPEPHGELAMIYAVLTVYGIGSAVVGMTTLDVVAGAMWALLWPVLVAVVSMVAFVGVIRSSLAGKHGLEVVGTLLLIALMIGYTIAIMIRTGFDGDVSRLPYGLLPVVVAIPPAFQLVRVARQGRNP
jgi:hypothetical protein